MWLKLVLIHLVLVSAVHSCPENCLNCSDVEPLKCSRCKKGFFNGFHFGSSSSQCEWSCPPNCKTCKDFDLCYVCDDGFYIGNDPRTRNNFTDCTLPCPQNCKTCTSHRQCSTCLDGFYLGKHPSTGLDVTDCTLQCPKRCLSCISHDHCSSCTENFRGNTCNVCVNGKYGPDCTLNCPNHCKQCTSSNKCTSCVDGFYNVHASHETPSICEQPCPENCLSCNSSTHCHTCKSGFYIGLDSSDDCSLPCPPTCKQCTHQKHCTECKPTYSGSLCESCPDGLYGYNCTETCKRMCVACTSRDSCTSCIPGYNGTSCDVCVDGKYGTNCAEDCPESCQTCMSRYHCQVCKAGYRGTSCQSCTIGKYGVDCESACPPNCQNEVCDKQTGACSSKMCAETFYGPYCNHTCPENCLVCKSLENCIFCNKGKHGYDCGTDCPENCKNHSCGKATGHCGYCLDGYHGNTCENKCPVKCKTCTSKEQCTSCKVGFTGHVCQETCGYCRAGPACTIDGLCEGGCQDGFYGKKCLSNCSSVCATCSSSDSYCSTCINGKYGKHPIFDFYTCDNDCPINCVNRSCHRESGNCFTCVEGYQGDKCDCPELCKTCSSPGVCSSCIADFANIYKNCGCQHDMCATDTCKTCIDSTWYPDNATRACCKCNRTCVNRECSSEHRCLNGCEAGYYGEGCDKQCNVKDQNCVECKSNHDTFAGCIKCQDGFYPNATTGLCISCHNTCVSKSCSSTNGHCTNGCDNRTWGERCDKDCPQNCLKCDHDKGHCLQCQEEMCSENCSSTCNIYDRRQLLCTANSSRCVYLCSDGCVQKTCDITTGQCLKGCEDNYFGSTCSQVCSDNCVYVRLGRRCSERDGTCVHGCKAGYFGPNCSDRCSAYCVNSICFGPDGDCTFGCTDGYTGTDCFRDAARSADSPDNTGYMIIVVVGISGAAIAVVIVFVIVVVLRKRSQKMKKVNNVLHTQGIAGEVALTEVIQRPHGENRPVYNTIASSSEGSTSIKDAVVQVDPADGIQGLYGDDGPLYHNVTEDMPVALTEGTNGLNDEDGPAYNNIPRVTESVAYIPGTDVDVDTAEVIQAIDAKDEAKYINIAGYADGTAMDVIIDE